MLLKAVPLHEVKFQSLLLCEYLEHLCLSRLVLEFYVTSRFLEGSAHSHSQNKVVVEGLGEVNRRSVQYLPVPLDADHMLSSTLEEDLASELRVTDRKEDDLDAGRSFDDIVQLLRID